MGVTDELEEMEKGLYKPICRRAARILAPRARHLRAMRGTRRKGLPIMGGRHLFEPRLLTPASRFPLGADIFPCTREEVSGENGAVATVVLVPVRARRCGTKILSFVAGIPRSCACEEMWHTLQRQAFLRFREDELSLGDV
jgi:hypothetical protein